MLQHLGETRPPTNRAGPDQVYKEGRHVTRDVGGTATTQDFTDSVIAAFPST